MKARRESFLVGVGVVSLLLCDTAWSQELQDPVPPTRQSQYQIEVSPAAQTASLPSIDPAGGAGFLSHAGSTILARSDRFYVYSDSTGEANHFFPTGWMGDWNDIKMNQKSTVRPFSGRTCLEFVYTAKATRGARWAGVYWQNPGNNWGGIDGRYDLRGARRLTFWARGKHGGEGIETVKVGGIGGNFPDSDEVSIGPVVLTTEWKKFTINLTHADLSAISGGFCWMTNADLNPAGMTFYLDDIRYEFDDFGS